MTANCCCGAVSITVRGAPSLNAICNCDDCKRRTGSAFGWNAYFAKDQIVEQTGETVKYSPRVDPKQVRHACPTCNTTLFWTSPFRPGEIGVAGGSFIDPPLPQPLHSAQDEDRCPWIERPGGMEPWP